MIAIQLCLIVTAGILFLGYLLFKQIICNKDDEYTCKNCGHEGRTFHDNAEFCDYCEIEIPGTRWPE
jgi:hypothetical protein